jgi:hypothetical protein
MSLLTVVQDFCRRTNIDVPTSVLGSTDEKILQVYALLQEDGDDLCTRGDWQQLVKEATHTTVATESQGAIDTIATLGFDRFKNKTLWNRSNLLPIFIISGSEWQQAKATSNSSPNYQVRLRGNELLANPVPSAGLTWAFEYVSNRWILDQDGTTYKSAFTNDADTFVFPEKILKLGLRWRWKKEKGLEYAEDFRTYELLVKQALGSNGLKDSLSMDNTQSSKHGYSVPEGNWSL